MKYTIATLGCKVNQFETQALEAMLSENGYLPAQAGECADIIIINTCAVTAESGRKSRQTIRRLQSENPGAVTAVCGCYSQIAAEDVESLGAHVIHGSGDKKRFLEDIAKAAEQKTVLRYTDDPFSRHVFEELPGGSVSGRTRAMLKIQDGCVNFCTYCIIPYTRGRVRSLPLASCAKQTAALAAEGYRELVVTGIEIAAYGRDLEPKASLADAVSVIAENAGDMRIRLGSLEPTVITEDFCHRLASTGRLCNHFHLSLQSGCDAVLKAMNRKYDTERFYESVELIRQYFPECALTADLIVGFPGETDAMHRESMDFIRECGFSAMHIFPYSIRPGTKAAEMPDQLIHAKKTFRAAQAQKIADEMENSFLELCLGKTLPVLFEAEHDGKCIGHAPNYTRVCVDGGQLHGLVQYVQIIGKNDKMLVGKVV